MVVVVVVAYSVFFRLFILSLGIFVTKDILTNLYLISHCSIPFLDMALWHGDIHKIVKLPFYISSKKLAL